MDISTVIQLTWIATSWELLAERDVLDALMPTCWHVLWLWWHHQLQGSDWCLKSEIIMLAECLTVIPCLEAGAWSDVSASVTVYERSGLLRLQCSPVTIPCSVSGFLVFSIRPPPCRATTATQPSSCRHFTTVDPAFVHTSTHTGVGL